MYYRIPHATEFYFWPLKGGYFRVDQYGLAYLQISRPCDKLVNIIFPIEQLPLSYKVSDTQVAWTRHKYKRLAICRLASTSVIQHWNHKLVAGNKAIWPVTTN